MSNPKTASGWEYNEDTTSWIRFRKDDRDWMYAWIDISEGYYNIDIPEHNEGRISGSLSDVKGDIAKCMSHVDKKLVEEGIEIEGGLPKELSHMSKSYSQDKSRSSMSEEAEDKDVSTEDEQKEETNTYGPTIDMAMGSVKYGVGIGLATKAQEMVNATASSFLKQVVGPEWHESVDHPMVQIFLAFGSPMFVHWITIQFEGMFAGQEEKIRAACKMAMIGQTAKHMEPALQAIQDSMGELAKVGGKVLEMNLLSDTSFDGFGDMAKEAAKEKMKETAKAQR